MNFQGEKDCTAVQNQYINLINYMFNLHDHYPSLYQRLAEGPQFEYEIEGFRKLNHGSRIYLAALRSVIYRYSLESEK